MASNSQLKRIYNLRPRQIANPPAKRRKATIVKPTAKHQSAPPQQAVNDESDPDKDSSNSDSVKTTSQGTSMRDRRSPNRYSDSNGSSSNESSATPFSVTSMGTLSTVTAHNFLYEQPWRFECEQVGEYRPGGYCPIQLHTMVYGRYNIAHKLGWGGRSTVWLALDTVKKKWVALKVLTARETEEHGAKEVKMHLELKKRLSKEDYALYIIPLLDWCAIESENGNHLCLAFGLSGPSIANLRAKRRSMKIRPDYVRRLARGAAEGVAKLHAAGITWGDSSAFNMVLGLQNIDDWTIRQMYERFGIPETSVLIPKLGLGRYGRRHAPDTLVASIDFSKNDRWQYVVPQIQFLDFGDMLLENDPDPVPSFAHHYADPETEILREQHAQPSDIWNLACVWFEMRSGTVLGEQGLSWMEDAPVDSESSERIQHRHTREHDNGNAAQHKVPWKEKLKRRLSNDEPDYFFPTGLRFVLIRELVQFARQATATLHRKMPCPQHIYNILGQRYVRCHCFRCPPIKLREPPREWFGSLGELLGNIGKWNRWCHSTIEERARAVAAFRAGRLVLVHPDIPETDDVDTGAPPPVKLSRQEAEDFEDVLMMMLTWRREDRASLEEILAMPWLDLDREYEFENGNAIGKRNEEEPWLQRCSRGYVLEHNGRRFI